jgi:hypothetical protein
MGVEKNPEKDVYAALGKESRERTGEPSLIIQMGKT